MVQDLRDLIPRVAAYAPGVADPVAEQYLRDSAIQFCTKTLCWQYDCGTLAQKEGEGEYELDLPSQAKMILPLAVWVGGLKLVSRGPEFLYVQGDWQAQTGRPKYFYSDDLRSIRVVPIPERDDVITARVACAPTTTATTLPDILVDQYYEAVVDGALARALAIPNQPFSDMSKAVFHARQFEAMATMARIAATKGHSRGELSALMRRP